MISKEQFVAIMKTLEEYDEKYTKLNEALADVNLGYECVWRPQGIYKSIIIDLLNVQFYGRMDFDNFQMNFNVFGSDIDYFIYVLNYGKNYKEDYFKVDGIPVDISTAEKLYDYLTKQKS